MTDGLLLSTAVTAGIIILGIAGSILTTQKADKARASSPPTCQEVVVIVERRGSVLARCPSGTQLDIVDAEYVVCRCPEVGRSENIGPDTVPSDTPQTEQPDPPEQAPQRDDLGTVL